MDTIQNPAQFWGLFCHSVSITFLLLMLKDVLAWNMNTRPAVEVHNKFHLALYPITDSSLQGCRSGTRTGWKDEVILPQNKLTVSTVMVHCLI